MVRFRYILSALLLMMIVWSCGPKVLPIDKLKKDLSDVPSYSIILADMEEKGVLSKDFRHKYQVVTDDKEWTTNWSEVPEKYYRQKAALLGMTLAVKKDGKVSDEAQPPGYAYVGDSRYGTWKQDSHGNSFWEFYGKFALMSHLFGMMTRPVYRADYNTYDQYRSQNRPYFGKNREYGTEGSYTKKQKPNFYARRQQRELARKQSFSDRVGNRVGRKKTGYRSRSGSVGK